MAKLSYLSTISNTLTLYKHLAFVKFDRNFKNNIYSFIKVFKVSRFKRRKYIRRQHLYAWGTYFNLLTAWASVYRATKKLSSFVLHSTLLKFRALGFNAYSLFPKNYSTENSLKNFFSAPLPKSYYHRCGWAALTFRPLPFTNPAVVNAFHAQTFDTTWVHAAGVPFSIFSEKTLLSFVEELPSVSAFATGATIFSVFATLLKDLYKLFLLLLLPALGFTHPQLRL